MQFPRQRKFKKKRINFGATVKPKKRRRMCSRKFKNLWKTQVKKSKHSITFFDQFASAKNIPSFSSLGIYGANARERDPPPPNTIKSEHFQRRVRTVYLSPRLDGYIWVSFVWWQPCLHDRRTNCIKLRPSALDDSVSTPRAA